MAIEVARPISAIGIGAYSLRDAALILGIPFSKLRRWAAGDWYSVSDDDRFSEPVVGGPHDEMDERILSFLELMELGVTGFYRSEGVSMSVVREARIRAQQMFLTEYPFATKRLETDGKGIFADLVVEGFGDSALTLELSKSQFAFTNCVAPFFRQKLDFSENGQAFRFWPLGRDMPVLLDAGSLAHVAGSSLPVTAESRRSRQSGGRLRR